MMKIKEDVRSFAGGNGKVRQPSQKRYTRKMYRKALEKYLPAASHKEFHEPIDGPGNLEYIIAKKGFDLSRYLVLAFSTTPEERAYQLLNDWLPYLIPNYRKRSIRIFLKHRMKSLVGTHCVFCLEYKGVEVEEQVFVVHVNRKDEVVMVCCTYLPNLRELLPSADTFKPASEEDIKQKIKDLGEYEHADWDKLWLIMWDQAHRAYKVVSGNQVKLKLPPRKAKEPKRATVLGVPDKGKAKEIINSPGAGERKLGLGDITLDFLEKNSKSAIMLDDKHIVRRQGILMDLESTSELIGRYAAIKDEIDIHSWEKKGIFVGEEKSQFDRVNAYYHLDYIQRYFREKLGLDLLDNYPHLNPLQIILMSESDDVAEYNPNSQKILFYQLGSKSITAARDPRCVYHEFVHAVTDAIARMHRAGQLPTPRAKEALQAQAMDEALADYFACSLAAQQGAEKAVFYYGRGNRWHIERDLDPEPCPEENKICNINSYPTWKGKKYRLAERWGRYLWQLRIALSAEVADMLIAQSLFFLTRWSTFQQGLEALRLADRLLFGDNKEHEEAIDGRYQDFMNGVELS